MDHMKLSDELRQQLLESAAWGKAGITPVLNEDTEEVVEEASERIDERKKKKKKGKKDWGMGKDEKSSTDPGEKDYTWRKEDTEHEDGEDAEELEEAVHVCTLCISQLEEAIDEERILEHLNVVIGLTDRLSQLDEGDEDIETVIDQTIEELLFQDFDEEEE